MFSVRGCPCGTVIGCLVVSGKLEFCLTLAQYDFSYQSMDRALVCDYSVAMPSIVLAFHILGVMYPVVSYDTKRFQHLQSHLPTIV